MDFPARVEALRAEMAKLDVAVCVLVAPAGQAYFVGFRTVYYPRPIPALVGRETTAIVVPSRQFRPTVPSGSR